MRGILKFNLNFFVRTILSTIFIINSAWATNSLTGVESKSSHLISYDIKEMQKPSSAGYFSLSPNHKFVGPVYSNETASTYVQEVFGLLLQAADSIANEFQISNRIGNGTYWAFLVAAMAVPHHESKLMHARKVTNYDYPILMCDEKFNNLLGITSQSMLPVLNDVYKQPTDPIIPNCSAVKTEGQLEQLLISSYNKQDMGLMQINGPTFREALMPEIYMNLNNTIRFGLFHLFEKFEKIRINAAKYPCLKDSYLEGHNKDSKPTLYYNLVQGVWGGGYNIGNTLVPSVCRFTNTQDKDHAYDLDFKRHLDAIILHDTSIFAKYLPTDSIEKKALDEIIFNFKNLFSKKMSEEKAQYVQKVLDKDYFSKYLGGYEKKPRFKANYYIKVPTMAFRSIPSKMPDQICGKVRNVEGKKPALFVEKIIPIPNPETGVIENWAQVRISPYTNFVQFTSDSIPCKFVNRDVFFVDASLISQVNSRDLTNVDLVGTVAGKNKTFNVREFYSLDSPIKEIVRSGEILNIVEEIPVKITLEDVKTGDLKNAVAKWYKVIVPGSDKKFGYLSAQAFDLIEERH